MCVEDFAIELNCLHVAKLWIEIRVPSPMLIGNNDYKIISQRQNDNDK